jgi:hypothetical protein
MAQGTLPACRGAQRFAEQLADAAAIGQARQHVDIGEVGQPLLRVAHVGDVEPDAAKAFEAAGGVDDRVAGQRDPAIAAAVRSSISRLVKVCLSSSTRPRSAWPPSSAGSEWPRIWVDGLPISAPIRLEM